MVIGSKSGLFAWAIALLAIGVGSPALKAQSEDRPVAITDAIIFDATGKEPFRGNVIIQDGRIEAVGPEAQVPKGAKVIRAGGRALLPGFFDVHTHWSPGGSPATLPQVATAYVINGVTTVNDFHQQPEAFEPLRNWLGHLTAAPHVNFVARMSTPGGHGADWADRSTTKWVATAESARREVVALQAYRPDFIKVFADGWRYGTLPEETSMNLETLSAIVDTAHQHGQRVLTHTVTVERGKLAARAGVDVIAHSLQDRQIDEATLSLMQQSGTYYAPTLAIYEPAPPPNRIVPDLTDPVIRQRYRKWGFAKQNLRMIYEAGIPVALGTDAGIGGAQHGVSTLREMELMVDAGLPAPAALMAATSNSAKALGLQEDRGTIEPGMRADLVIVTGEPWRNISDVRNVRQVIIDGKLVYDARKKLPNADAANALPADRAGVLIDDFERSDGRSALDTLRLVDMDGGVERSVVLSHRVPREEGGSALAITVQMTLKDSPEGGVIIPLRRGSVQPVDVRGFAGVQLDIRGTGHYQIVINTLNGAWTAEFESTAEWAEIRLPFSAFQQANPSRANAGLWRGDDLLEVGIVTSREAGATVWAEIDDLGFYRD